MKSSEENFLVSEIVVWVIRLPLPRCVWLGETRISEREFCVVEAASPDGTRGWGYTFTRGAPVDAIISRNLAPLIVGADARETFPLWKKMQSCCFLFGTAGLAQRAISVADIAIWDLKARLLGQPLFRLLGGTNSPLSVMVPGGYRPDVPTPEWLEREMDFYRQARVQSVKLMLTPRQWREIPEVMTHSRKILGDKIIFGNDFHSHGTSASELLHLRGLQEDGVIDFIEDPFPCSHNFAWSRFRQIYKGKTYHGELMDTVAGAESLVRTGQVDVLRWDATACGGVTGWLKMTAIAQCHNLDILPHCFPEVHSHLCSAAGLPCVESILPEFDTVGFGQILDEPPAIDGGKYPLSDRTGLGASLLPEKLKKYAVARHVHQ